MKVDSGANQVFQRNVRALRIGSLVKDAEIFADDRRKHDYRNMDLPRDAYKAYPKPKTAIMKEEEYRGVLEQIKLELRPAISSFHGALELK